MRQRAIRVTGTPKAKIDADLLAQAIVAITEQQLQRQAAEPAEPDSEVS